MVREGISGHRPGVVQDIGALSCRRFALQAGSGLGGTARRHLVDRQERLTTVSTVFAAIAERLGLDGECDGGRPRHPSRPPHEPWQVAGSGCATVAFGSSWVAAKMSNGLVRFPGIPTPAREFGLESNTQARGITD